MCLLCQLVIMISFFLFFFFCVCILHVYLWASYTFNDISQLLIIFFLKELASLLPQKLILHFLVYLCSTPMCLFFFFSPQKRSKKREREREFISYVYMELSKALKQSYIHNINDKQTTCTICIKLLDI